MREHSARNECIEWIQYGNDWILSIPARRRTNQRCNSNKSVRIVTLLAATLLSYVMAPPVLWLCGASSQSQGRIGFLYTWIWVTVPRIAAALLALQICLCLGWVGWQYLLAESIKTKGSWITCTSNWQDGCRSFEDTFDSGGNFSFPYDFDSYFLFIPHSTIEGVPVLLHIPTCLSTKLVNQYILCLVL